MTQHISNNHLAKCLVLCEELAHLKETDIELVLEVLFETLQKIDGTVYIADGGIIRTENPPVPEQSLPHSPTKDKKGSKKSSMH